MDEQTRRDLQVVADSWVWRKELAGFARARHGFANTDGGYGISYPDHLDDDEPPIAAGHVRVWGDWGEAFRMDVPEADYLEALIAVLCRHRLYMHAAQVAVLWMKTPRP